MVLQPALFSELVTAAPGAVFCRAVWEMPGLVTLPLHSLVLGSEPLHLPLVCADLGWGEASWWW